MTPHGYGRIAFSYVFILFQLSTTKPRSSFKRESRRLRQSLETCHRLALTLSTELREVSKTPPSPNGQLSNLFELCPYCARVEQSRSPWLVSVVRASYSSHVDKIACCCTASTPCAGIHGSLVHEHTPKDPPLRSAVHEASRLCSCWRRRKFCLHIN